MSDNKQGSPAVDNTAVNLGDTAVYLDAQEPDSDPNNNTAKHIVALAPVDDANLNDLSVIPPAPNDAAQGIVCHQRNAYSLW